MLRIVARTVTLNYVKTKLVCNACFKKSFSISVKVKFWNYDRNTSLPREVFLNSNSKYWFVCEKGHDFDIELGSISSLKNWCRYCVNKTEQKMQDCLLTDFLSLQRECTPQWSNKKSMISSSQNYK